MLYPALPGSVRVSDTPVQRLTRLAKRRLKLRAARLDPYAFKVLDFLLYGWRWVGGVCDPALSTLAAACGMSRSTVQKRLRVLEGAGLLQAIRRGRVEGSRWVQATNLYLFRVGPSDTAARQPPDLSTREQENKVSREREEAQERGHKDRPRSVEEQIAFCLQWAKEAKFGVLQQTP